MERVTPLPKSRRRWFRYSLRTLFVVVTVVAIGLAYQVSWIRKRHALLAERLRPFNGECQCVTDLDQPRWFQQGIRSPPAPLRLFRERGVIELKLRPCWDDQEVRDDKLIATELERARRLFPEAKISLAGEVIFSVEMRSVPNRPTTIVSQIPAPTASVAPSK